MYNFKPGKWVTQEILNTTGDGSTSKSDPANNDSAHSSDSSGIRDVNEMDSIKLPTSQASSLSLSLSLPNQSELLPIAEEKDSPGGSSKAEPEAEADTDIQKA